MENTNSKLHAIQISAYLQGHVIPSVHLAIKLALKGFTITFVNTESVHHQIIKSISSQPYSEGEGEDVDIFAGARKSGLDIRYRTVSDGFPLSFNRMKNFDQFHIGVMHVFPTHVDELVGNLVQKDPSISCLIADSFFTWPSHVANKYNLVNISFWTQPVLVLNLFYHVDLLIKNGHFASDDNRKDSIDYMPGVKAIDPKDLVSFLQETDISTVIHEFIFKIIENTKESDILLCNTIQEIEPETISIIQKNQQIYAIGPIFPTGFTKSIVPTTMRIEFDCTTWLKTKPNGSVLYVSFGSTFSLSNKTEFEEIAIGLLLSEVNFIWVLRPDSLSNNGEEFFLPVGFEDGIKNRGLIVPWCCQIEVISNPAIGGFLTHCGWNSILESIWCGVPLLCYPLFSDQFTNRKLVVDDWKIGYNLCDKEPLNRVDISEKIKSLIRSYDRDLKREIKKLRLILQNALAIGGSSENNLCEFIRNLKAKVSKRVTK